MQSFVKRSNNYPNIPKIVFDARNRRSENVKNDHSSSWSKCFDDVPTENVRRSNIVQSLGSKVEIVKK